MEILTNRLDALTDELRGLRVDFRNTLQALTPKVEAIHAQVPHLATKADLRPFLTVRGLSIFVGLLVLGIGLGVSGLLWLTGQIELFGHSTSAGSP